MSPSLPTNVSLPSLAAMTSSSLAVDEKQQPSAAPANSGTTSSSVSSDLSTSSHRPAADAPPIASSSPNEANDVHARGYYYLSPNAVKRLPHYQYRGADLSLLYKHVLSPIAAWLVDHATPTWIAPKAITFFGCTWRMRSYCVIWYWCPGLYEANTDIITIDYAVPKTIFLLNGCAMIIYQTLDNMDGKQARKTGTSSPLGLLFDHGCDAMNLILGSANWIAAVALIPGNVSDLVSGTNNDDFYHGDNNIQSKSLISAFFGGDAILAYLLIFCPMIAFYVSTWEQYYTGTLILPPFNGPSEGLIMGASLSIVSFFWGPMFWQETSIVDIAIDKFGSLVSDGNAMSVYFMPMQGRVRNMDLVVLAAVVSLVQEVVLKTGSVVRKYGVQSLRTMLPHLLLVSSTYAIVHCDPTIFLRCPRTMMHLISGLFTEQTTQLMLDHMVEEEYEVRKRWCLLPQVLIAIWMTAGLSSVESLDAFLLVYTTGLWVYLGFKIRVYIHEICDVLGIYCFDIVTPHPKRVNSATKKNN